MSFCHQQRLTSHSNLLYYNDKRRVCVVSRAVNDFLWFQCRIGQIRVRPIRQKVCVVSRAIYFSGKTGVKFMKVAKLCSTWGYTDEFHIPPLLPPNSPLYAIPPSLNNLSTNLPCYHKALVPASCLASTITAGVTHEPRSSYYSSFEAPTALVSQSQASLCSPFSVICTLINDISGLIAW